SERLKTSEDASTHPMPGGTPEPARSGEHAVPDWLCPFKARLLQPQPETPPPTALAGGALATPREPLGTQQQRPGRAERRVPWSQRGAEREPPQMRPFPLPAWAPALLALLSLLPAEGYVLHLELDCPLSAEGHLLGANWTLAFNKMPFVCYAVAYQEFLPCGLGVFPGWDQVAGDLSDQLTQRFPTWGQTTRDLCQQQLGSLWNSSGGRRTPPNVRIFPITPQNTPAPVMLACDVWDFYPADVAVTWLRNGVSVKDNSGVQVVSNGDWTYQTRLSLPVYPQSGETYTCRVEHASLRQPLTKDWEPGLTPELKVKVGVAGAVLGVGVLFLIAGIVSWKKRAPAGYIPIDGDSYPPVGS
ncbi:class II histocompatibility antigen, M beta 1 chain, partial [Heteronotia binoei]|uniref:class II histocompatibility antigen, M beta 1 chain n=1 Tax=Heteronotia binoei TaxID=13085 RepID=UPI0029302F6A